MQRWMTKLLPSINGALRTRIGVDQASANVVRNRQQDTKNESKYISNDLSMNAANRAVLKLFGKPQIHQLVKPLR